MLKKLIKYEWKNTYKVCGLIILCTIAITILGCISLRMPLLYSAMNGGGDNISFSFLDAMGIMTLIVYIISLMGASYGILIFLGVHFYKSMYTDEGYLTHTLPVTAHQILISKIFVSGMWMLIITLVILLSVVSLIFVGVCMYLPATPMRLIEAVGQELSELPKMVSADVISGIVNMGVILIIMLLVTPFCTMMMLFGAITLGQLFTKYRALMAIVCYIGTGIVNGIIAFVIQIPVNVSMMTSRYDPMKYYYNTYIISIILSLCMGVLFYFLSHMILTKKFDIE